jgi:hypothetical protein
VYRALADAGRLNDFFDLAQDYFAGASSGVSGNAGAFQNFRNQNWRLTSALAGSLLSLLGWWQARSAREPPDAMDRLFHRIVWSGLQ